jgi:gas vesicle protein
MTRQTKIVTGVLAGAALGTAIALILMSDKNNDLKQKANEWLCDLFDKSKDKFAKVEGLVKERLQEIKV